MISSRKGKQKGFSSNVRIACTNVYLIQGRLLRTTFDVRIHFRLRLRISSNTFTWFVSFYSFIQVRMAFAKNSRVGHQGHVLGLLWPFVTTRTKGPPTWLLAEGSCYSNKNLVYNCDIIKRLWPSSPITTPNFQEPWSLVQQQRPFSENSVIFIEDYKPLFMVLFKDWMKLIGQLFYVFGVNLLLQSRTWNWVYRTPWRKVLKFYCCFSLQNRIN